MYQSTSKGNGKKCGNSFIPKSQKCRKGMGGPNSPARNGGEAVQAKGGYRSFLKSKGVAPETLGGNSKRARQLATAYGKTKVGRAEITREANKYRASVKKRNKNTRNALLGGAAVGAALGVGLEVFKRRR